MLHVCHVIMIILSRDKFIFQCNPYHSLPLLSLTTDCINYINYIDYVINNNILRHHNAINQIT